MKVEYSPIGFVHSPYAEPIGVPIQPSRGRGIRGEVEVFPEYSEGLADLDGFSHIMLLVHLHRVAAVRLTVVPFLDTMPRGVFATRAPSRPNPIGLSVVRLLGVCGTRLEIQDLDIVDQTPVLDIKPYVPDFEPNEEIRVGWLEAVRERRALADDRFAK